MSKYFVLGEKKEISRKEKQKLRSQSEEKFREIDDHVDKRSKELLSEEDSLVHVHGRVVVKLDIENKNRWRFGNGTTIRYERQFDNLNRRHTEPVNAIVISGENIRKDTEILIHPNAIHDSYRIFNYKDQVNNVRYYSIPEEMCFAYRENDEWLPLKGFDFGLRVFVPYSGRLAGITPTQLKDTLWVTTGELKWKAVLTVKAADYEVIFQDINGKENRLIRFRALGHERTSREPEAVAILNDTTDKILNGDFLIGLSVADAKPLENIAYAD